MVEWLNQIDITDYELAKQTKNRVTLGHYFVYVEDVRALNVKDSNVGRRERLLLMSPEDSRRVIPIVEHPIELAGITISPSERRIDPIGCLVADRDLYRAEQDTVHLYIAFPKPQDNLQLRVEINGEPFTERDLDLQDGVAIETLSDLLAGTYTGQLTHDGRKLGVPISFTVAEYSLAPLSASLVTHQLDSKGERLTFQLRVESYQVPFEEKVSVTLLDRDREVSYTTLSVAEPGCYSGSVTMQGEGPFRLRIMATKDAERVAEVAIPGSRTSEREATLISELGQEFVLSTMPAPEVLPIRGGYLSKREINDTPLTVNEIVTKQKAIQVQTDVDSLVLVSLDLSSGGFNIQEIGSASTGQEIVVQTKGPFTTVFAGCFVDGRPFEGYTTFIEPSRFQLTVETPVQVLPQDELTVRLECQYAEKVVPVLLCIKDERLTSTDTPEVSLVAAAKRAIQAATADMAESGFTPLSEIVDRKLTELHPYEVLLEDIDQPMFAAAAVSVDGLAGDEGFEDLEIETAPETSNLLNVLEETSLAENSRAEFPQVLFYGIVPVKDHKTLRIPSGATLGTFSVEAFAILDGDWNWSRKSIVVDKPVRVDLELPPAVYPDDQVLGRLRAVTSSGEGRVSLSCSGEVVPLYIPGQKQKVTE